MRMKIIYILLISIIAVGCLNSNIEERVTPYKEEIVEVREETVEVKEEKVEVKEETQSSKYEFYVEHSCGFDVDLVNQTVYSFGSDIEADNALAKIMKLTGLPGNFEIRAASVDNACAVVKCDDDGNCKRYILYNQEFMEKIKDGTRTNYAEFAVLAHEIGHHLSGHTLTREGSSHDAELEADKFAGFMLYKLGASIDEAKQTFDFLPIQGSRSHPPKAARIAALSNGWYDAKRNGVTEEGVTTTNSTVILPTDEANGTISTENSVASVKIGGLEVMNNSLEMMNWYEARSACKVLGNGWRVPTLGELKFLLENKDEIGGFNPDFYWSSSERDDGIGTRAWRLNFLNYRQNGPDKYEFKAYVRAVREY